MSAVALGGLGLGLVGGGRWLVGTDAFWRDGGFGWLDWLTLVFANFVLFLPLGWC